MLIISRLSPLKAQWMDSHISQLAQSRPRFINISTSKYLFSSVNGLIKRASWGESDQKHHKDWNAFLSSITKPSHSRYAINHKRFSIKICILLGCFTFLPLTFGENMLWMGILNYYLWWLSNWCVGPHRIWQR